MSVAGKRLCRGADATTLSMGAGGGAEPGLTGQFDFVRDAY